MNRAPLPVRFAMSDTSPPDPSPRARSTDGNPRLFLLFRIFFNCRFYYPVYAIMFLDFGLTMEQFAALNVAWAVAIVLLEVPSGALADHFGRRSLVIAAAVLMLIEMIVLAVMPVVGSGDASLSAEEQSRALLILFTVFMINRVVSGAAEAAASGADEALAYDSLPVATRDDDWSHLTSQLMKWQSAAFILVTLVGAAVYDPEWVNGVLNKLGVDRSLTQGETLKYPIYLNVGTALSALYVAVRMREPERIRPHAELPLFAAMKQTSRATLRAGAWILRSPAALMLLLIGLFFDSIVRLYYTVGSIYLRLLQYEERHFGMISVAGSVVGIFSAWLAHRMIKRLTPDTNVHIVTLLIFVGLVSLAFPIPWYGVVFLVPLWLAMRLLHFFLSNYLNRITDSEHRATVLSFRGLTMNLSYGAVTLAYGVQSSWLRNAHQPEHFEKLSATGLAAFDETIFSKAISTWWIYFVAIAIGLWLFQRIRYRKSFGELIEAGSAQRKND